MVWVYVPRGGDRLALCSDSNAEPGCAVTADDVRQVSGRGCIVALTWSSYSLADGCVARSSNDTEVPEPSHNV